MQVMPLLMNRPSSVLNVEWYAVSSNTLSTDNEGRSEPMHSDPRCYRTRKPVDKAVIACPDGQMLATPDRDTATA